MIEMQSQRPEDPDAVRGLMIEMQSQKPFIIRSVWHSFYNSYGGFLPMWPGENRGVAFLVISRT